mmetsp:Transcript_27848/g.67761  ORF Transcript_27848/g.67761 Transcript_27848/m.67761 type:complete len:294 (-) Transcript_27848:160-1041(-)
MVAQDSALISFLSGGVGGIAAVVVGHPFDLVKVRLQTSTAESMNGSLFRIMQRTVASEGVAGLYRGVSAPLLAVSPIYAISFWGYDIGQRLTKMMRKDGDEKAPMSLFEISCAGGISALPTTVVMAPTERLKCLLQTSGKKYSGLVDCARQVYSVGGIRSLYKGTVLTLARDIPGSIAWFGTYEMMKRELAKLQGVEDPSKLSPIAIMVAGGFAGMACWGVCIPPDTLKSRFQTSPEGKYSSVFDVYRHIVKEEGHGGLLKGFRPAMARAFPANAACFSAMELSRSALNYLVE